MPERGKEGRKGEGEGSSRAGEAVTREAANPPQRQVADAQVSESGFNPAEVLEMLREGSSTTQTYKVPAGGAKAPAPGRAGNMANGQNFMAQLSRQLNALQAKK